MSDTQSVPSTGLAATLRRGGLTVSEIVGVSYNPLADTWRRTRDLGVNYMVFAVRA